MPVVGASRTQAGLYYDKGGAVYNIMHPDFGGDPSLADNAVPITAAVDTARANGGTVLIPPGRFKTSQFPAKHGANIVGMGGTVSVLQPITPVCMTVEEYGIGFGQLRLSNFGIDFGSGTPGTSAIVNAGTLDRTQQSYGLNIDHLLIQNCTKPIALRSYRNVRIWNNWLQNVGSGIDLTGWLLDIFVDNNWIVKAAGAGGGADTGVTVDGFNFSTNGGVSRPEAVYLTRNQVYGFNKAFSLLSALDVVADMNDLQALVYGIEFTAIEAGLDIDRNYIQVSGAAGLAGIIGHGLGAPLIEPRVGISRNRVIGSGTVAANGIQVNDSVNQNQDSVDVNRNLCKGWTVNDIQVNNGNDVEVRRNRCLSTGITRNIYVVGGVGPAQIKLDENKAAVAIDVSNPALIASGLVDLGINTVAGIRVGARDTWTTPTFAAGNFTAAGAMTWTVDPGDAVTLAYALHNRRMTMAFYLNATTVGGTLNNELRIALPAGFTAAKRMIANVIITDNGVNTQGYAQVLANGTYISIFRFDGANFAAATNTTNVFGEIAFEVNP